MQLSVLKFFSVSDRDNYDNGNNETHPNPLVNGQPIGLHEEIGLGHSNIEYEGGESGSVLEVMQSPINSTHS